VSEELIAILEAAYKVTPPEDAWRMRILETQFRAFTLEMRV
jgi:hypothetical protein